MPEQFYRLTWKQYKLMRAGYLDKIARQTEIVRFATWSIITPHVKKMPGLTKFWPLSSDQSETPEEMANRIKERLIRAGRKFDGK